jgi:hypothetical protein
MENFGLHMAAVRSAWMAGEGNRRGAETQKMLRAFARRKSAPPRLCGSTTAFPGAGKKAGKWKRPMPVACKFSGNFSGMWMTRN